MWLAIDTGNTHSVLGVFNNQKLLKSFRVSTHPVVTEDEFRSKLIGMFAGEKFQLSDFKKIVISSVVPPFSEMVRRTFPKDQVYFITHESPLHFGFLTDYPEQIGADRLVNAEAAVIEYGSPVIVLDSGTATTICGISGEGKYLGGAIMPGVEMSIDALTSKAAKLFPVELQAPKDVIGKNTQEALQSGILNGYSSMIDGMIRKFKKEMNEDAVVVATGGISSFLSGIAQEIDHFDKDLTLKGIAKIYERVFES